MFVDEYLELTRTSRREEALAAEVERLRNTVSFKFGNIFVQAVQRPILLPLLPFRIVKYLFQDRSRINKQNAPKIPLTRNCVVGYSSSSPRGIHFERMEIILDQLRQHKIETIHITNDREIRSFKGVTGHSLYSIPPRTDFTNMIPRTWNKQIERILSGILDTFHPRTIIFDGDYPFRGVLSAISLRPEMNRFWIRESMLNFKISSLPIDSFDAFDATIHPSLVRRDDPDSIIGKSGTIFCNPIIGSQPQDKIKSILYKKLNPNNYTLLFVQINRNITNQETIYQELLSKKNVLLLCLGNSVPKQFIHNERIIISNTLTTKEAISIADVCFISPDLFNIYSCFEAKKPTMCITESKKHLDSIYREFGSKKLPFILIDDQKDEDFISDALSRILDVELQHQLIERMDEIEILDGTSELCEYIKKLHDSNKIQ